MSPTTHQSLPKMNGNYGSDMHKLHGGGISRASRCNCANSVAQPSLPPTQNVVSADNSLRSAVQFGGNYAIYAENAVTTATF